LAEKNIPLSQSTIRRYVRTLKGNSTDVYIPLEHEAGESMQVDWGDNVAVIDNVKTVVSTFCVAFPYSYAIAGFVYPNKKMICFLDGHIQSFEFFHGVPKKCVFDNLKTAVFSGYGVHAIKQSEFKNIEAHYGFESIFCNIASGNEKSHAENAVKTIRNIAFKPIPHVKNFEELQKHVTNKCMEHNLHHSIKGKEGSVSDMFSLEKKQLMPLPKIPFSPSAPIKALVYPDLTVIHEGTKYSVPQDLVNKQVTLSMTPFLIKVYHLGELVYTHKRVTKKFEHQYVLEHYVDILSQKSRAIDQAKPIANGVMPEECSSFLKLCKGDDRKQQLVDILLLGKYIEREILLWAIEQANNTFNPTLQLVKFFLNLEEMDMEDSIEIETSSLEMYDKLLEGGE
jgi:hypothetical protein